MKFFCLKADRNVITPQLLAESCKQRGIEFVEINPTTFDYTEPSPLSAGDLFYRATDVTTNGALEVENFLLNSKIATFYTEVEPYIPSPENLDFVILQKNGFPIPLTINHLTNDKQLLKKYADYVGGFPLIIKALGGSHGVGVMKVDSLSSLFSLADHLYNQNNSYILREFISVTSSARLVVLGDQVIDSIEYSAPEGDFRSNEGKVPNVKPKKFNADIENLAVKAVKSLSLEFGGVDILVDANNKVYITEVNFPCFFARCQMLTKVDISGQMIDYLVNKSKSLTTQS